MSSDLWETQCKRARGTQKLLNNFVFFICAVSIRPLHNKSQQPRWTVCASPASSPACSHTPAGPTFPALACEEERKRTDGLNLVMGAPAELQWMEKLVEPFYTYKHKPRLRRVYINVTCVNEGVGEKPGFAE